MKFSLSWLKDHLDTDATATEIAAKLNAIGLEVEGLEDPAEALAGFRIARVLTASSGATSRTCARASRSRSAASAASSRLTRFSRTARTTAA